jgi:hypothetical protein
VYVLRTHWLSYSTCFLRAPLTLTDVSRAKLDKRPVPAGAYPNFHSCVFILRPNLRTCAKIRSAYTISWVQRYIPKPHNPLFFWKVTFAINTCMYPHAPRCGTRVRVSRHPGCMDMYPPQAVFALESACRIILLALSWRCGYACASN